MNLNEITEDRAAARQAFLDYRAAFRKHGLAIDRDLMRGYKELAAEMIDELVRAIIAEARATGRAEALEAVEPALLRAAMRKAARFVGGEPYHVRVARCYNDLAALRESMPEAGVEG